MTFQKCFETSPAILMEGALGERLKREFFLQYDPDIAMAGFCKTEQGREALKFLWREYLGVAERYGLPFMATTPTRRANRTRMERAGQDRSLLKENVALLREALKDSKTPAFAGGLMGSHGDAYTGIGALEEAAALEFHRWQAEGFVEAGVDFLYAGIMPTLPEAAGMARAMAETGIPYIISFTIERNGCLINGTRISDAIAYIDACTEKQPLCYMTNCVHPTIVNGALRREFNRNERVMNRFLGIQANTSPLSYALLDNSEKLHSSPPEQLAEEVLRLRDISRMKIFGGCCGTDGKHMEEIARRL